jgi:site-specific DNA-methyltransferase (adenine-specific)
MIFNENKNIKIYNGDAIETINNYIKEQEIDVVITSPPYNLGKKYSSYNDKIPFNNYINWMNDFGKTIYKILKSDGSFFLNIGYQNLQPSTPFILVQKLTEYFKLQNTIIWTKSITVNSESYGHFIPNNSNRYLNNIFEYVFHFTKDGSKTIDRNSIGVPYKDKRNIERFENNKNKGDVRCGGNVWFIPHKTVKSKEEKFNHPTSFPDELVRRCILLNGYDDNTKVLDPFMGVGTTLKACVGLNINGIGIDVDKNYCEIAKNRIDTLINSAD